MRRRSSDARQKLVGRTTGGLCVLHFTPRFLPNIGGVELHVARLTAEQRERGMRVDIISSTTNDDSETRSVDAKYRVHRFISVPSRGRVQAIVNIGRGWAFIVRNLRLVLSADLVHFHDYVTFLWSLPIILFLRRPKFMTFHGYEGYPVKRHVKMIRHLSFLMTDGSIGVGRFIEKWYGTNLDKVTLPGVDVPLEETNAEMGNGMMFIGRLAGDTGIMDYLDALRLLHSNWGIRIPLEICGDGPLRESVIQYANQYGLDVTLRGVVANPEQRIVLRKFLLAGGYQSILLAMAYRRPVFAIYDNPLKKDYLESFPHSHEMLFITSSTFELARELEEIIVSGELPLDRIENAYRFASEQTWKRVADTYDQLYLKTGRS